MELSTRLKQIRKAVSLTQDEFSKRLGLKRNTIATYETGRLTPSDRTISDICREFGVSEAWLRTGTGEMFPPRSRLEELSVLSARFLSSQPTEFQQRFAQMMYSLSEEEWALLEQKARSLLGEEKK